MFLNELTADQKNSFMALATRMVLADGKVQPEEDAFLDSMRAEMGGGVQGPPEEVFGMVNPAPFENDDRAKTIVVLELMVMGYADASFHPEEDKIIIEACEEFGLDPEIIERLKDLARQEAALIAEALAMIGPSSGGA